MMRERRLYISRAKEILRLLFGALCLSSVGHAAERGLVVLAETGQSRDGVPVLRLHSDPAAVSDVLTRGFSGRLLRLYRLEQEYLFRAAGSAPEPAYLLLSGQWGGFPRFGFYLDGTDKTHGGFVDLHRSSPLKGRFGSMDQIFPHELAHIIVHQLAGELRQGGSNQMHAIGVRTDPNQAFSEGFAEHFQVMAIDDPEADPATKALASDADLRKTAEKQGENYVRELQSPWAPVGPMRMGFLVWFSGTEQVWRYFAVKANAFAHANPLPRDTIFGRDLYRAYLVENVAPGSLQAPSKSPSVLLSTEGWVSTFFYRWVTDDAIRRRYRDPEFYARFGVLSTDVSPLENCYLKLFHVLFTKKPSDTAGVVNGYKEVFPDESPFVDALVRDSLLGQRLPSSPSLWLANRDFKTGTSLFDQFRCLPRTHTFDLNAATMADLLGVPGVTRGLAERILAAAPYTGLDDLKRVPELPQSVSDKFAAMSAEMRQLRSETDGGEGINLRAIMMSYVWRALLVLVLTSAAGAFLYWRARQVGWVRSIINGFAASFLVLVLAWMTTGTGARTAFLVPVVLFGVPAALWQLARRRKYSQAARVLLAWMGAAIPAILVAYPWL